MITTLMRPFTAVWEALVRYHAAHIGNDPDVERLREQRRDAEDALRRINIVEREYLRSRERQHGHD